MSSWRKYTKGPSKNINRVSYRNDGNQSYLRPPDFTQNQRSANILPISYRVSNSNVKCNTENGSIQLIINLDIEPIFPDTIQHNIGKLNITIRPIQSPHEPIVPNEPMNEPIVPNEPMNEPIVPNEPILPNEPIIEPILPNEPIVEPAQNPPTIFETTINPFEKRITNIHTQQIQQAEQTQYMGRPGSFVGIYNNSHTGVVSVIRSPKNAKPYYRL
jgi:hypothetical protein